MRGPERLRKWAPLCAGRLGTLTGVACICAVTLGATPAWASMSTKPASTWQTNGRVNAILNLGGITYLGGRFTEVSDHAGHAVSVSNLAALDANGDLVARWTPRASSAVKALAADGPDILAGGAFTKVDGKTRLHLALISPAGSLRSFNGHANREVDAVAVSGGTVYAGGGFTRASGAARSHAAAFAATGGGLRPWNPSPDGRVDAILAGTTKLIIGGMFSHAGGIRAPYLTAVDPTSGSAAGWAAHASAPVLSLAADNGSVFAALGGKGGMVAAYSESTGSLLWRDQTDGNVQAITTSSNEVVPGGHFNNFCDLGTNCKNPVARHKIAALSETTGALDARWHPYINSKLGVFAALGDASGLEIGGDFSKVAGTPQAHFARFTSS
jgi:Domain of unknown function (DUF5122) beta-propeller